MIPLPNGKPRVGRYLIPGDSEEIKVVRHIFRWFVKEKRSLNEIASMLNKAKIATRSQRENGKWSPATIKEILTNRAYVGDFIYNQRKSGEFNVVLGEAGQQEVVRLSYSPNDRPIPWRKSLEGAFVEEGVYKAIIDRELFAAAQEIIAGFKAKGWGRRRSEKYALSGILVCGHCGQKMYACEPPGRPRCYRCSSNSQFGKGTCGTYEICADLIEPFVFKEMGLGVKALTACLTDPPPELPRRRTQDSQDAKCHELMELAKKRAAEIEKAEKNALLADDPAFFKSLQQRVKVMRAELKSG